MSVIKANFQPIPDRLEKNVTAIKDNQNIAWYDISLLESFISFGNVSAFIKGTCICVIELRYKNNYKSK
jgi:hypothetical protein